LEQEKLTDAITLLEELYNYHPGAARPLLAQSLLEKVKIQESLAQSNEDEVLNIYDRILMLIPNQPEALEQRKLIWEKRGEIAYSQKKYIEAIEAFKVAGSKKKVEEIEQKVKEQEIDKMLAQINYLEYNKEYTRALKILNQIERKYLKIEYFQHAENLEKAIALRVRLEQKIKLNESYQFALIHLNNGNKEKAKKIFEEIVSIDSDFEDTLILLLGIVKKIDVKSWLENSEKLRSQKLRKQEKNQSTSRVKRKLKPDPFKPLKEFLFVVLTVLFFVPIVIYPAFFLTLATIIFTCYGIIKILLT
jgi:tetratricopeptide (TPR) repeat protein